MKEKVKNDEIGNIVSCFARRRGNRGGASHRMDVRGFSRPTRMPCLRHNLMIVIVKDSEALPRSTFFWFASERPRTPIG